MSTEGLDLNRMLGSIMEQARTVQGRMSEVQERLKDVTVEGEAGGGIIQVTATGAGRVAKIRIEPVAVDPRDIEMLEDLITAAVNDALRRAQETVQKEMGGVTGGLDMGELGSLFSQALK